MKEKQVSTWNVRTTVYQSLSDIIEHKEVKVGALLPSESELMKQFDVSRDTIRKALNLLLQNRYIQKAKGKGSVVLGFQPFQFYGFQSCEFQRALFAYGILCRE